MVTPAIKDKVLVTSATYTAGMAGKEPTLAKGTTAQYYRGDKTWQNLNKAAVGLANVDNTADVDKPVSTPQSTYIETQVSKSFPVGAKGMVPFIRDDNSRTAEMSRILKIGEFAETDAELADSKSRITTMATVFNEWFRFSHDGTANQPANADEINNWAYNASTDTISCTVNSATYIGFVSKTKYDKYLHEVRLSSTDGDDDAIGVVIAFAVDSNGKEHTLSALRSSGGVGFTWRVVYNYNRADGKVIQDKTTTIKWGNGNYGANATEAAFTTNGPTVGWDDYPTGTKVKIDRNGDIIKAITTDLGNEAYVAGSEITVDLTTDPLLAIFRGPAAYGFSAISQNSASYKVLTFSETANVIYDLRTNTAYTYTNSAWVVDATKSLYADVGVGRILYNRNSGKLYFMESDGPKKLFEDLFEKPTTTGSMNLPGFVGNVAGMRFTRTAGLFFDNGTTHGFKREGATPTEVWSCDNSGVFNSAGDVGSSSDERLKTNWRGIDTDDFIAGLAQVLHGVYDRTDINLTQVGVGAQSLEKVAGLTFAVRETEDGIKSVSYGQAALVAAVKLSIRAEQQRDTIQKQQQLMGDMLAAITDLQQRVATLETK